MKTKFHWKGWRVWGIILIVLIIFLIFFLLRSQRIVFEDFIDGANGWEIVSARVDGDVFDVEWNENGFIRGEDPTAFETWYFSAPSSFYDHDELYGATLSYSARQSGEQGLFEAVDVIIQGAGGERVHLALAEERYPQNEWTDMSIRLSVAENWVHADGGQSATESEMRAIVNNISGLLIRGEYRSGDDWMEIDKIEIAR